MHYLWPWNIRNGPMWKRTHQVVGAKATAVYHAASTCLIVIFIIVIIGIFTKIRKISQGPQLNKTVGYSKSDDHVRIWQAKESLYPCIATKSASSISSAFTMRITCKCKNQRTFEIYAMFFTYSQLRLLDCNGFATTGEYVTSICHMLIMITYEWITTNK